MNPRAQKYRRIYDIPNYIGTAVNGQMMVFDNTGERSATGVGFMTRCLKPGAAGSDAMPARFSYSHITRSPTSIT